MRRVRELKSGEGGGRVGAGFLTLRRAAMLSVLKISNLALVEDLTWELGSGLVCVTGETGAGKSIIVGALKLILGERADRGLVRSGEESCTVEAVFHLANAEQVNAKLAEFGADPCDEDTLIVKRTVSVSGGNRQFVNCSPATLQVLKALGQYLVDLHGPHEHQSLMRQERQLAMLDAYAESGELVGEYRAAFRALREAEMGLEEISGDGRAAAQQEDLLRYQVEEIAGAHLRSGEEAEVEQRYKLASNSQRMLELCGRVAGRLGDVMGALSEIRRDLPEMGRIDPEVEEITSGFDTAQLELQAIEEGIGGYVEELEMDPAEAARLEERIHVIETLKRKYGRTVEEVMAFGEEAAAKLAKIEGRDEEVERLKAEVAERRKKVLKVGERLSAARAKAAPKLAKEISSHLEDLGFERSQFEVALAGIDAPGANGLEEADFLFAPNPGEPSNPLRLTASSGEMSRVMLAVKSALAKQDAIPLLVFDEIDANVGGGIAQAVGAKMASLGGTHQVISITHLPQVAALAGRHYVVTKFFDKERTRSVLREVEGEGRVGELVRMLGGSAKSAEAHARNLLGEAEANLSVGAKRKR